MLATRGVSEPHPFRLGSPPCCCSVGGIRGLVESIRAFGGGGSTEWWSLLLLLCPPSLLPPLGIPLPPLPLSPPLPPRIRAIRLGMVQRFFRSAAVVVVHFARPSEAASGTKADGKGPGYWGCRVACPAQTF